MKQEGENKANQGDSDKELNDENLEIDNLGLFSPKQY